MMNKVVYVRFLWTIISFSIGIFGAWLASILGLPAAAILGSVFTASLGALTGLPLRMPNFLRNAAFTVFGCSLGSSVTVDMFSQFARWSLSLTGLVIVVVIVMVGASWALRQIFKMDMQTAVLSTSPGALSYNLSLAEGGAADIRIIMVLQSLRLLLVISVLPLVLGSFGQSGGHSQNIFVGNLAYQHVVMLIAVTYILGMLLSRFGMPAAYLITGLVLSGGLHLSGTLTGKISSDLLFIGFVITGTSLGARFSAFTLREIVKLLGAACVVVTFTTGVSAIGALIYADLLTLPFGQVWVAYAPGGLEAMAALALALDYDPAYVAVHHIFRLLFLIVLLPLLLKYFSQRA